MKRFVLALLVSFIAFHAPWRLMALVAETFVVPPGQLHTNTNDEHYWDVLSLEDRLGSLGWTVEYTPGIVVMGQQAYGATNPDTHIILLDRNYHWNVRYSILAHEAGHTMQPSWVGRAQGEIFAESVAALLAHDGIREHARYLAAHRFETLMFVATEWQAIYHAAAVLSDR